MDEQIARVIEDSYDAETGELLIPEEEMFAQIARITQDFDVLVDSIASDVKNLQAEAADVKEEKMKLQKRQSQLEARAERAKRFLTYLLNGEKWKNGRHSVSYRKSEEVVYEDDFIEWAMVNRPDLVKIEPEVRKLELKNAIKNGETFEFAHIEQKSNIQIK